MTVMLMIVLAQFPSTRWIAVMLSNNGNPDSNVDQDEPPAPGAAASNQGDVKEETTTSSNDTV
jgi:hypothetical protein